MEPVRAAVLTCSDRVSRGEVVDKGGPRVQELLEAKGHCLKRDTKRLRKSVEIDGRELARATPLREALPNARRRKEKLLRESLREQFRRLLERIAFFENVTELAISQEMP